MLVRDFVEQSAERCPDKLALVFGERRLTYAQVDEMASRLANALVRGGVARGDRVAIYLDNSVEAAVSIFAVLKANAVFTVVNATTKPDKLAYVLNNCRATALVTHGRRQDALRELSAAVPSLGYVVLTGGGADPEPGGAAYASFEAIQQTEAGTPPPRRTIDADLAALIYTSGSTGWPKGVMATHLNMVTAATSITTYLENIPEDIIINALPLSFDYGLYQLLMAFKMGATLVLERGFVYPQVFLRRLAEERVTGFPGVPTIFAILLQLSDLGSYPNLRYITNTAAALPVNHIARIRQAFPQARLYSMYGLTECKRVSYLPPAELDRRPGSVGIAIPNTEVWVADDEGRPVPPGVVGELVVRGSHVTRGYWENPEETRKMFRPGLLPGEMVLYTGDLFRMDEDGFLYFVARKDDIIKTRGEKVSPKEVENVLYALPAVAEAVIGVPDTLLGEAIRAYIVPAAGRTLTEREVIGHCRRHLEDFMVPTQVVLRTALPKTESGKIHKPSLRSEEETVAGSADPV